MSLTYMENMEKKVDLMDIHNLLTNAEKEMLMLNLVWAHVIVMGMEWKKI